MHRAHTATPLTHEHSSHLADPVHVRLLDLDVRTSNGIAVGPEPQCLLSGHGGGPCGLGHPVQLVQEDVEGEEVPEGVAGEGGGPRQVVVAAVQA